MTRIAFFIGVFIATLFGEEVKAQSQMETYISQCGNKEEYTVFTMSKQMCDIVKMTLDNSDNVEEELTGDLNKISLLYYNENKGKWTGREFRDEVVRNLKKDRCKLIEDEDNSSDLELFAKRKGKKVYQFHLLFSGKNFNALVSFFGDMDIKEVKSLKTVGCDLLKNKK